MLRADFITIFPEFFSVLGISLLGKAQDRGLLRVAVHNLRQFSSDGRVDDTSVGVGPGMVMQPEPWARALEEIGSRECEVIFPTPAGEPFSQVRANELSKSSRLVFACGRYEGIDERVYAWAEDRFRVWRLSLGDYVLNGGEVAAAAMFESIARLVPGVMGNPESLVEESFCQGLLEYPVYTKPATWRGRKVPEILLSGNHRRVREYRRRQQEELTARIRPELYKRWRDAGLW